MQPIKPTMPIIPTMPIKPIMPIYFQLLRVATPKMRVKIWWIIIRLLKKNITFAFENTCYYHKNY